MPFVKSIYYPVNYTQWGIKIEHKKSEWVNRWRLEIMLGKIFIHYELVDKETKKMFKDAIKHDKEVKKLAQTV